jgi:translation initiation factor IF-1
MVRNTQGGSKTKSMARKSITNSVVVDYNPSDPLERVATVEKLYGNGMCQVITTDAERLDLLCHIRGKFRGRSKKHNMLTVKSKVVIGLREWETPYKTSDLISVLSTYEDVGISKETSHDNDSFVFSSEDPTNFDNFITPQRPIKDISEEKYQELEINIDDI